MPAYEHLGLAELDDLVAQGAISFDDYWDARIAIDAREHVDADVTRFDLPLPESTEPPPAASPLGTLPDGPAADAPGGPDWIGPPPRPAVRSGPPATVAPMVAPPPPPPPPTAGSPALVQLDIVGPSADAAATRADDRKRSRRWRPTRRERDPQPPTDDTPPG